MERIGFISLDNMGEPIIENLTRAGFPMTVLDLNPAPVADLASLGAAVGNTPSEVAASSEIICSVVVNDRQKEAVSSQGPRQDR